MRGLYSVEFISFGSGSRENGILWFKFTGVCILHLNQSDVMHLNHKPSSRRYFTMLLAFIGEKSPEWALMQCSDLSRCSGTSWIRLWWTLKPGLTGTGPSCSSGRAEGPSSSSSSCPTRTTPSPTATSSWRNWRDSTPTSKKSQKKKGNG